jgi:hypothetical protein
MSNTKSATNQAATAQNGPALDVRKIETSLINKEEVFRMLALAESTALPVLLVGPPGVGKTKTVLDYAKAWLNKDGQMTAKDFAEKIYILETDEGTKPSEIKGVPDLQKLFTDNKFELNTPIAEAEIVIINEVDKASSNIRNAMLGVMNEKFLFNGKFKIPCKWKLFIATCNEIPKEEKDNPFWDRFMLKMNVGRVTASEMVNYYEKGDRLYKEELVLQLPTKHHIESFQIPMDKLSKYIDVAYNKSSDRTLTFAPKIAKCVKFIWNCSLDKALVKTAQIMIDQSAGSTLNDKLISPEYKRVINKIEVLPTLKTKETLQTHLEDIAKHIKSYVKAGKLSEWDVQDLEINLNDILRNHATYHEMMSEEQVPVNA